MTAADVNAVVETVHRRSDLLSHLCDGPLDKPTLCDRLGVSRSTVDRGVRDLEAHELARRVDGRYAATVAGRLSLCAYVRLYGSLADVGTASPLFDHLTVVDETACALDLDVVRGATTYRAAAPTPFLPAREVESLVEGAARIEGMASSILNDRTARLLFDAVCDEELVYECVYSTDMAQFVRRERGDERAVMAETGRYRAFEVDDLDCPFEVFVVERDATAYAVVLTYAGETLRGALVNDDPHAVSWARASLARVRERSTEITDELAAG